MAKAHYLTDEEGKFYPYAHTKATYNDDGTILENRLVTLESTFTPASSTAAGAKGLVTAPAMGDQDKFLKGDGTWATVDPGSSTAADTSYDNTTSGLTATNVQTAIDEVYGDIPDELADLADDTTHRVVTDVEKTTWNGKMDNVALADVATSGDYDDLTNTPTIPTVAVEVSESEYEAHKAEYDAMNALIVITDATDALNVASSDVTFTQTSSVAATNVQDAIEYVSTHGSTPTAEDISYDDTATSLGVDNVQDAIEAAFQQEIKAENTTFSNTTSGLTSDNVQGAIDEVVQNLGSYYEKTETYSKTEVDGMIPHVSDTYSATSGDAMSGKAVAAAIDALPDPMVFKGSLGTGGTVTELPTASESNTGHTYKVITDGEYAGQEAQIGDTFISDGSSWILIPSGDEPSGTVTSVAIENGGGLDITGSPITSSGTITITNNGVRSVTSGSTNGTLSVNTNGTTTDVAVTGLGTAAYVTILYGTDTPTSNQGNIGDIYIQYTE